LTADARAALANDDIEIIRVFSRDDVQQALKTGSSLVVDGDDVIVKETPAQIAQTLARADRAVAPWDESINSLSEDELLADSRGRAGKDVVAAADSPNQPSIKVVGAGAEAMDRSLVVNTMTRIA